MLGPNSWSYTRLGHIDADRNILESFFGSGDCQAILSLHSAASLVSLSTDNFSAEIEYYDLQGKIIGGEPRGLVIQKKGNAILAKDYDIIFIGYPIWWDLCLRVVNTWIEGQQLKGKTIISFATSGGSSIANSQKTFRKLYPELNWKEGKLLNCSAESTAEWAKTTIK